MLFFFLIYLTVYGLLQFYFFSSLYQAFHPSPIERYIVYFFLLIMVLAPLLNRFLIEKELLRASQIIGYLGYVWMAFSFLFIAIGIILDMLNLLVSVSSVVKCILPAMVAVTIMLLGYFEAGRLKTTYLSLSSPLISKKYTIVQISDLHISLNIPQQRIINVINRIKALHPDLLVSTGDLTDSLPPYSHEIANAFNQIKTPLGKYAVTGNHEYYHGIDKAVNFTQQAGFIMLHGDLVDIDSELSLCGVDDPAYLRYRKKTKFHNSDETLIFKKIQKNKFSILLKHQPRLDSGTTHYINLQLSGHTHQGQIFPFNLLTRLFYKYNGGFFRLNESSSLYVSRGTGTWGPPIRFLSPPEVTVIELIPQ